MVRYTYYGAVFSLFFWVFCCAYQTSKNFQAPGATVFHNKTNPLLSHHFQRQCVGGADQSFGCKGIVKGQFLGGNEFDIVTGMVVLLDGSMIVSGYTGSILSGEWQAFLTAYTKNGLLDRSFGTNGIVLKQFSPYLYDQMNTLIMQPGKGVLLAGETRVGIARYAYFLARYTFNGMLDTHFGVDGVIEQPFIGDGWYDEINALAVQSDGLIIVAGYSKFGDGQKISVVRYTADGQPDSTFGTQSIFVSEYLGLQQRDEAIAVAIQPCTNRIIVGATSVDQAPGKVRLVLLGLTQAGVLDRTWGVGGLVQEPFLGVGCKDQVEALAMYQDGSVVVAGSFSNGAGEQAFLIRYTKEGVKDRSFGTGGVVAQPVIAPGATHDCINALALQPDGKIIAVGKTGGELTFQACMMRYTAQGQLDTTFGVNGILLFP